MFKFLKFLTVASIILAVFTFPQPAHAAEVIVNQTVVNGQVKDQSNHVVVGANISITCNGNTVGTTTDSAGKYHYQFDGSACPVGVTVTAQATAGSQSGAGSAPVQEIFNNGSVIINLALINISVPEFGLLMGLGTTITSAGAFFLFRRKIA